MSVRTGDLCQNNFALPFSIIADLDEKLDLPGLSVGQSTV